MFCERASLADVVRESPGPSPEAFADAVSDFAFFSPFGDTNTDVLERREDWIFADREGSSLANKYASCRV